MWSPAVLLLTDTMPVVPQSGQAVAWAVIGGISTALIGLVAWGVRLLGKGKLITEPEMIRLMADRDAWRETAMTNQAQLAEVLPLLRTLEPLMRTLAAEAERTRP